MTSSARARVAGQSRRVATGWVNKQSGIGQIIEELVVREYDVTEVRMQLNDYELKHVKLMMILLRPLYRI